MIIVINILLVLFFVLMNAFFVCAEFALVKVRKSRLEVLVSTGSVPAKFAYKVVSDLNSYLSACQLGITLASLALGWIGEPTVSKMIGPLLHQFGLSESTIHSISIFLGFFIITGLHIVLGELVPKSLAIISSEKFSIATGLPLFLFYRATYPIMWLFNHTTNFILKLMGYSMVEEHEAAHTDDEIKILVEESYKHGLIDKTEYTYVDNIFEFTDKQVKDIMIPRMDMVCVYKEDSFETILKMAMDEKYTRYPVCEGDKDNVVGFIHIRDLYEQKIRKNIKNIDGFIRSIISVPESMPINEMLKRFKKEKKNIAVVIDEYGGTAGMVTIEDVLEEIVGDLNDEYDEEEDKEIDVIDEKSFVAKGIVDLDKVADLTGAELPVDEYDTLSGFLIGQLGRIPSEEEKPVIEFGGFVFKMEKVEDKRVLLVKISKIENVVSSNE
ncbi:hemolysin family protein [Pseudobacteroides cellulosolvens]|uniref:Putative signal transduction protein with CBS domain containing protein n=1 Tax=Pseudobacteroides cellulosolvens ATCC 35603 = DSM 2933 TaxID=398512 RepID=A0A0L6JKW7_9FIRM|nr:hemolysin family protein [Pseudobacteroides cellulosolvens]KNY26027.1 putative signal transduction protein with CBS domain containing protein [Pseudobacteroides cellulosolvens ATCC 35603 = DSM 2933]